jgi:tetratricopeptide (TPR) repeat protein
LDQHPFVTEQALDRAMSELADRGLLGWDRRANRYDLHPIVRGVVWSGAAESDRQTLAERMSGYFYSIPTIEEQKVEKLDELTAAIELYVSLIRLSRFEQATDTFRQRLDEPTLRLNASRHRLELLGMLFPNGLEQPGRLSDDDQAWALHAIGQAYFYSGEPRLALRCFRRAFLSANSRKRLPMLESLMEALRQTGELSDSESLTTNELLAQSESGPPHWVRDCFTLQILGELYAARGDERSVMALHRALWISRSARSFNPYRSFLARSWQSHEALVNSCLAQSALWRRELTDALRRADRAWELARLERHESYAIRAARLQGEAALAIGDLDRADERLHHALTRARAVEHVQEELPTLTALAALHHRRGHTARAREHLDDVWDAAERGPYPLLHADACNVLAEIEIAENNIPAAIAAATAAYRLAWCDGPPFAYDYGLRTARAHLRALGAPEPEMPPYDASKHEPIEEINIEEIDRESEGEQIE